MSIPTLVEVCIGMAFLYLVLSLMVTTVNEIIATLMKLRAKDLRKTVISLVDNQEVRKRFYAHGLIRNAIMAANSGRHPATPGWFSKLTNKLWAETEDVAAPAGSKHSSYLDGQSFAMALLASLDKDNPIPAIGTIRIAVNDLKPGSVRDIVGTALADAGEDINNLRDSVAESFDVVMDQLSGEYKRKTRFISVWVGIGIAVALNADSYAVSQALWHDSDMRDQTVAAADEFVKNQYDKAVELCDSSNAKQGSAKSTPGTPPTPPARATPTDFDATTKCVAEKMSMLDDQLKPFPLGWGNVGPSNRYEWAAKSFGLFWTGLALSLGAPFWFDILQNFINIRGAGKKPETTKGKKAKSDEGKAKGG